MPNVILTRNIYPDKRSLEYVIGYALRSALRGGYGASPDPKWAFEEMYLVKRVFYQTDGVQLKHFFITFSHEEAMYIDFDEMMQLAFETARLFAEYQMVYGLHMDGSHIHIHIVMNTTSFMNGHQYSDGLSGFMKVCGMLKKMYPQFPVYLCQTRKYSADRPFEDADRYDYQVLNSV